MKQSNRFIIMGFSVLILSSLSVQSNVSAKALGYYDYQTENKITAPVSVVYTKDKLTNIYNSKGDAYDSLHLAPHTGWRTGIMVTHNTDKDGVNEYYQVSTDGYVKESDVTIVNPNGTSILHTTWDHTSAMSLSNYVDQSFTSPEITLPKDTYWKIGKVKKIILEDKMEGPHQSPESADDQNILIAKRVAYLLQVASDNYVELTGYDNLPKGFEPSIQ